jgi:FkbM family methyltransferase
LKDRLRKAKKLLRLLTMHGPRDAVLRYGVAATTEHDFALSSHPFNTIIDIGANRGQFSLAARHHHPGAKIVAFEPLQTAAAVYRNVFKADVRTTLQEVAVSPVSGTAIMQVSRREDSSSLLPITALQTSLYPEVVAVGQTAVPAAPLDSFMTPQDIVAPALLKIDVQGFELEVLKASLSLLPRFECIYVEASFMTLYEGQALAHEVIDYLHSQGFRFTGLYNPAYHSQDGGMVQADLLFEKTS